MVGSFTLLVLSMILAACEKVDPEERRLSLHLPPPGFKGDTRNGRTHFQKYCMECHGQEGKGTPQGPPLVHKIYQSRHHANLSFHIAVRDGVKSHHWSFGDMKPVLEITPEETEHVVAYIRQEQKKEGIE